MFLYKDNIQNIATIKRIVRCFELALRLKVNLSMSFVRDIRVDSLNLQRYAALINYRIMAIPFVYLGILIDGNHKRVNF